MKKSTDSVNNTSNNGSSRIPLVLFLLVAPLLIWAWYRYPGDLTFAGIFWATAAVVFGSAFLLNKRKKVDDAPMRKKMLDLQQQGVPLYYETEASLNADDIAKLMNTVQKMYLLIVVLAGIGLAIVHFLADGAGLAYIIFFVFMLIMVVAIMHARKDYLRIMEQNKKIIIRGLITNRFEEVVENTDKDDETVVHYLRIGNHTLNVTQQVYDRYPVGQAAEIHFVWDMRIGYFLFKDEAIQVSGAGVV